MLRSLRRTLSKNEKGQALPLVGLCLFVLIGFVAMSIDVGRLVWARTQMQAAVDASALAAAQSLPDWNHAETTAEEYWLDNSGFIQDQGTNIQFSVVPIEGNKALSVSAEADIPTWFAKFFGVDEWHVSADGDAESIVIDAMLVLDRSGSMCFDNYGPQGNYVGNVRLTNSINSSQTTFTLTRSNTSIPLSSYVYVGQVFRVESSASTEWMQVTAMNNGTNQVTVLRNRANPNGGGPYGATSHNSGRYVRGNTCLQAGAPPYYPWEYVKDGSRVFVDTFNPDYDRIGLADFGTRGESRATMTNSLSSIDSAIVNLPHPTQNGQDEQYTNIEHGLYMGIRELTTNGRTNAKWVLVILGDGVANRYCSTLTVACASTGTNSSTAYSRAVAQANQAAIHGITIYTIGYGDASDDALMQDIAEATGGQFFKAPNAAELEEAFLTISKLTHIRLSR